MMTLEETVKALAQRVAALERERAELPAASAQHASLPSQGVEPSRKGVLIGGAGLIGALASGAMNRPERAAAASSDPSLALAHVVQSSHLLQPRLLGQRVTVPSEHGGGYHAARYEWDLSEHFSGDEAPVVVAVAHDNYHRASTPAELTCAVDVQRAAGSWRAVILVNNVAHLATEVTINAIALGT